MKNVKTTYVHLYNNLSPRFLKTYFSMGGPVPPSGPPVESPMGLCLLSLLVKEGTLLLLLMIIVDVVGCTLLGISLKYLRNLRSLSWVQLMSVVNQLQL